MKKIYIITLFSLLAIAGFSQTTRTVCPSGCNNTTVAGAVSASSPGDIVQINAAVHTEKNIYVGKNITIQGLGMNSTILQGHASPSSAGATVIRVDGANLTVKNLTIRNGEADGSTAPYYDRGGAIHFKENKPGDLTCENVKFLDNEAESRGGAIFHWDGSVNITGCEFINNTGVSRGGAIYMENADGTIDDCLFEDNTADRSWSDGGAIYHRYDYEDGGDNGLTISNCDFIGNYAERDGGAIFIYGSDDDNRASGDVTVVDCTFDDNYSDDDGGAIHHAGGDSDIDSELTFYMYSDNCNGWSGSKYYIIDQISGDTVASGGADFTTGCDQYDDLDIPNGCYDIIVRRGIGADIDNYWELYSNASLYKSDDLPSTSEDFCMDVPTGEVLVSQCSFDNNGAYYYGGAIYMNDYYYAPVTIDNCDFNRNYSDDSHGGSIYLEGETDALFTISNSAFDSSYAEYSGGDIYIYDDVTNFLIDNCDLTNSYANDDAGGAIYISYADGTISNSTFTNCFADYGGAVYLNYVYDEGVYISNCDFDDNLADYGAGVYLYYGDEEYQDGGDAFIDSCNFSNNYAYDDGGALYINWMAYEITNSTFTNNYSNNEGGGAIMSYYIEQNNPSSITNCTFEDNYTDGDYGGGAYICYYPYTTMTFDGCTFTNNSVDTNNYYGGAIYIYTNYTYYGFNEEPAFYINNSTFTGNKAYGGGAVFIDEDDVNMYNNTFVNNSAEYGGAIYYENTYAAFDFTWTKCTFEDNDAKRDGGAIYFEEQDYDYLWTLDSCTFDGNYANYGGGIYMYEESWMELNNCTITNNEANYEGGFMYHEEEDEDSYVDFRNCTVSGNTAEEGGAIYSYTYYDLYLNIYDCLFENNSATDGDGGAIYDDDDDEDMYLYIENSTFRGNTADGDGGAIYHNSSGEASISGSTFTENYATGDGGAINNYGADDDGYFIQNSTFYGNSADNDGGALYAFYEMYLDNVTLTKNICDADDDGDGEGGAIWDDDGYTYLKNTICAGNIDMGGEYPEFFSDGGFDVYSDGFNLIGDLGDYNFIHNTYKDRYGDPRSTTTPYAGAFEYASMTDAMIGLDTLADYDGPTWTCALLNGSLALNNGVGVDQWNNPVTEDQRGMGIFGIKDIGAYERFCYNRKINPTGDLCVTQTAVPLSAATGGGTFSGTGVTGSTFDPSVAGAGTHTITYTFTPLPYCDSTSTKDVTVYPLVYAGTSHTIDYCNFTAPLDLWDQLGNPRTPGGVWTDDNLTGGLTGSVLDPTNLSGAYNFTYTVEGNGCPDAASTLTVTMGLCTDIIENKDGLGFSVYPNPSNGNFTIEFVDLKGQDANLKVVDMQGKVMHDQIISSNGGGLKHLISLLDADAGLYMIQVQTANASSSVRIVVQ